MVFVVAEFPLAELPYGEVALLTVEKISRARAREIIGGGFEAAVEDAAAAEMIGKVLGVEVRASRATFLLGEKSEAIVIRASGSIWLVRSGRPRVEITLPACVITRHWQDDEHLEHLYREAPGWCKAVELEVRRHFPAHTVTVGWDRGSAIVVSVDGRQEGDDIRQIKRTVERIL